MRHRLPPLRALVAFESVVRCGGVGAAAEELLVTHSAVSKQIAILEEWVGEPLFAENRRVMVPTAAAARLADGIGMALKLIGTSFDQFSARAGEHLLRVLAPSTFAMRWLLPRLPDFQARHEDIRVRVTQTHTPENWLEMPFDVAIRRGGPVPPHFRAVPFMREKLGLVCTPGLKAPLDADLDRWIGSMPLLMAETRTGELESWLQAAGFSIRIASSAIIYPHFYTALEAALAGRGGLVSPMIVIDDLLGRGVLVEPVPSARIDGPQYLAAYPQGAGSSSPEALFADWLAMQRQPASATDLHDLDNTPPAHQREVRAERP
ncbi:DNA-binding transcriptional LysR family regulator [Angulomicrobium tetraedrale]|uniref:DNA-binding transcriptional LysR family regulator n=1 Tax=Ancylobacter tetraedralis TaxID=217068 RepID=A0A839ZGS5_9HYPH|nr:LysR substrate-binding domain-containing protein [Ancylobacter tetraedralis]MBB3773762.1 DNA-binding transcriptional LysR family regulator [Ancylobacter tetraedralis]